MKEKTYKIGEVSKIAGVTIRTLRYYDSIDLLKPSRVLENRHRSYDQKDIEKLQLIMGLKLLNLSLTDIKTYIERPNLDLVDVLKYQKQVLHQKIESFRDIINKIDFISEHYSKKGSNKNDDIFTLYDMMQMANHNEIVRKYFSNDSGKVLNTNEHGNHEALNKAILLLEKSLPKKGSIDQKFILNTFSTFIKDYFGEVSDSTIMKMTKMTVEMIDMDPNTSIGISELELYRWLCINLLKGEDLNE